MSQGLLCAGVLLLLLLVTGRLVWEQFKGENPCEMTYMYQRPTYLVIIK